MKILKQINFDLIILDIVLPDYHGADLIPLLKSIQSNVEIIAMTRHNTRKLELMIRNLGVIYYIIKPFDMNIITRILAHMKKRKSL
ncbi:MAG: response regulator [Deltaproteobacteria bacterium]|nr:response regulator [Deltaproteobacteria bacterium]